MAKIMPDELKSVLNEVITVNFIKGTQFRRYVENFKICKESGSEFETLLLHCYMKWLPKI
ncbi:hypothetical protein T4D_4759 [Trichinella pseudospiralis]|uniref:SCAN domain-containing protein 3 n=1 Tax=Trichinella pseudospiralis TaxID=6337 RepID=A0A0V1G5W7_TRIPS|nr:hypothetical protein T4D_4759 [Trichinella pseudospiralis]